MELKYKTSYSKYDGQDMVSVVIQKSKDGNLVEIANIAKKELENMKPLFPSGSKYEIIVDNSIRVKDAISNVTNNGLQALVITVIVLLVFLKDLRASLVVWNVNSNICCIYFLPFKYTRNLTKLNFTYGSCTCDRITG